MTIDECFPTDADERDAARELGEQLWDYLKITHVAADQSWKAIVMAMLYALHNSIANLDASINALDYFDTIARHERARLEAFVSKLHECPSERIH